MSFRRRQVTRVDASAKDIIDHLEAHGYIVVVVGYPVDVFIRHPSWQPAMFMAMELKTLLSKTGRVYTDSPTKAKKMQKQLDFIAAHQVPVVTDAAHALARVLMR